MDDLEFRRKMLDIRKQDLKIAAILFWTVLVPIMVCMVLVCSFVAFVPLGE
jgi:hypothetical protein